MKGYLLPSLVVLVLFMISPARAAELPEGPPPRPAEFSRITTEPANTRDLYPFYSLNQDGDGEGEELPSSISYLQKNVKDFGTSMTVTDLGLCRRPLEAQICRSFTTMITANRPSLGTEITASRIGGAGYVTIFLAPITAGQFPGVDQSTAFLGLDSQDTPQGEIVVYIYGQKGTNLIQLTTPVTRCTAQLQPNESDISFYQRCISPTLLSEAQTKAQQLTTLFRLNH